MSMKREFREVAGEALEETRAKFERMWIRPDLHTDAVNFALGLFCGIAMRKMSGEPDPDMQKGKDSEAR